MEQKLPGESTASTPGEKPARVPSRVPTLGASTTLKSRLQAKGFKVQESKGRGRALVIGGAKPSE
jgi:hypothetical protein